MQMTMPGWCRRWLLLCAAFVCRNLPAESWRFPRRSTGSSKLEVNSENACWTCWWNLRATRTSVVYCLHVLVLILSLNTPYEDRTMYQHAVVRSPQRKYFWKPSSARQKKSRKNNLHVEKGFYTKANMKKDLGMGCVPLLRSALHQLTNSSMSLKSEFLSHPGSPANNWGIGLKLQWNTALTHAEPRLTSGLGAQFLFENFKNHGVHMGFDLSTHPSSVSPHAGGTNTQSHIKEYWVDVQTTGSFDDENEETFVDKTTGEGQAASFDLGLPATDPCAAARGEDEPEPVDTDHEVDDDMDDGTSSRMSRTRGSPQKWSSRKNTP